MEWCTSWEDNGFSHSQEIKQNLVNLESSLLCSQKPATCSYLQPANSVHAFPSRFFEMY